MTAMLRPKHVGVTQQSTSDCLRLLEKLLDLMLYNQYNAWKMESIKYSNIICNLRARQLPLK
jgi:hypothetical protein